MAASGVGLVCEKLPLNTLYASCRALYQFKPAEDGVDERMSITIGTPFNTMTVHDWQPFVADDGTKTTLHNSIAVDIDAFPLLAHLVETCCDHLKSIGVEFNETPSRIIVETALDLRDNKVKLAPTTWAVERLIMDVEFPSFALILIDGDLVLIANAKRCIIAQPPTLAEEHLYQALRTLESKVDANHAALTAYLEVAENDNS